MQLALPQSVRLSTRDFGLLALALGVVLTAIWAIALRDIRQVNQQAYHAALASVEHDTDQLALEWEAKLAYIDALYVRAREITRMMLTGNAASGERIEELKAALTLVGPDFAVVSGFDPSGQLIWSTNKPANEKVSIGDRAHFRDLVENRRDRVVGSALVARVADGWTIPFLEANRKPDGSLNFVTGVAISANIIKTMTRFFDPQFPISLALMRRDSEMLAREPPGGIGERSEIRQRLINNTLPTGSSSGRQVSSIDGVARIYAFRVINGTDLLVDAAIYEDAAMATAHERAKATIMWSIVLSVISVILLVSWAFSYQYRRFARARRAMLERALDHEALLTHFAANATDMIALFDKDLNYMFINAAFEKTLGLGASELLGRKVGSITIGKNQQALKATMETLVKEKTTQRFLSQVQNTNGKFLWIDAEFVAIDGADSTEPRAPCYMMTGRDVTQQVETQEELLRMQQHVAILLKMGSGILGTIIVDMDGRKLKTTVSPLSPNYERIRAAVESGGEVSLKGKVFAKDLPRLQEAYRRCIAEGRAVVEVNAIGEDGEVHQRRAQLVLAERQAETCEIVVYASDITDEYQNRRKMELSERLATLGEVTTHLAHELNQPVASILLISENGIRKLERESTDVRDTLDRLNRIRTLSIRMGEIIGNVRRFGRADPATRQKFELGVLLQEVEIITASRLASGWARLVLDISPELPALNVPRLGLAQVLINLVVNACDAYEANSAIPTDQRLIRITARSVDQALQISVSDTAGGVPPDLLARIFDNFFTTKSPDKGNGVGLSISRTLIREMGGEIEVANVGGGAVFTVTVPLVSRSLALQDQG